MGDYTYVTGSNDNRLDFAGAARNQEKTLVIVKWRDIVATAGWEQAPTCPAFFSVGWLISDDADTLTIAMTYDPEGSIEETTGSPAYYAFHSFPRGCVVSVSPVAVSHNPQE